MSGTLPKLLIVDDQPASVELLLEFLARHPLDIAVALDGEKALVQALSFKPDLILLDIVMPDMDGFEVCRRLKQINQTSAIPVIFLSGNSDVPEKLQGFSVGGVDYITKPFSAEEVLARIYVQLQSMKRMARLESMMQQQLADQFGDDSNREHQFFSKALAILEADLIDPPGLQDLAHRIGTNERKITDIFRHRVGMTVYEYLIEMRMETARALLEKGDTQVSMIAAKVGYRNPGDFSRAFRQHYNVTPREYRHTRRQVLSGDED